MMNVYECHKQSFLPCVYAFKVMLMFLVLLGVSRDKQQVYVRPERTTSFFLMRIAGKNGNRPTQTHNHTHMHAFNSNLEQKKN